MDGVLQQFMIQSQGKQYARGRRENGSWSYRNVYTFDLRNVDQLKCAVKGVENSKGPGLDKINSELLKYGGVLLELKLLCLRNRCWVEYSIAEDWKTAKVIFSIQERQEMWHFKLSRHKFTECSI